MEILKYVILLILLGCFVYMIYMIYYMFKTAYHMISFNYCKPKYRINKNGYVEYYISIFNYWDKLCGWDSNDTERTATVHGINNTPIEIKYKGPGRIIYYLDKNLSGKKLREEVDKIIKYKTGKECYEHQAELINKECIILANKVKIKYEVTE